MTLDIRNIWNSLNKGLTIINIFLLGLILMSSFDFKKAKETKIPVVFNILLLAVLLFIVFALTYGAYRRENS